METTYFTCTLGQAIEHQCDKSYNTINDFIQYKAHSAPDTPVVGFYEVNEKSSTRWRPHVLTFKDIYRGTAIVAGTLSKRIHAEQGQTIALLCPSSADFLFTWLALIWLGHSALLIAPQCSPSAIAQLCKSCNVKYLLHDEAYEDLASKAATEAGKLEDVTLSTLLLPLTGQRVFEVIKKTPTGSNVGPATVHNTDVAYLHHTSGTSSGTPKPIPQTHNGALGVLPTLDDRTSASFTTTPLYHGGVADLFRAWASNAMIWLFPGKELPITAVNVRKCLDVAAVWAKEESGPEVKFFSSVPYVLQMMAEDNAGSMHLQKMDIVGVGGAALPAEIGNSLVSNHVNLISRFGSAECGFLMSSHRDYTKDSEWQYLRSGGDHLRFEAREDGLSELVIGPGWPHMAKRNRQDGSFATADLFAPHPTITNAWRYHSRADSQLTLITGKKFDPAPLEDAIRASASALLDDVLIFGNGKPYPGVLLIRSEAAETQNDEHLISKIAPIVEKLNRESQSHARLPRNMLIAVPHLKAKFEKSSKGTLLRTKAEERFHQEIEAAYENVVSIGTRPTDVPDREVSETIRNIVVKFAGESNSREGDSEDLTDETDLFGYGVDSVAGIQIRQAVSRLIPPGPALPLTVVQDAGTISRLAEVVLQMRSGESAKSESKEQDERDQHRLMVDLVKKYSTLEDSDPTALSSPSSSPPPQNSRGKIVLLTGPTGSLGAHILSQLLSNDNISHIHLLVRGATSTACHERVIKALTSRQLSVPTDFDTKVQIHSCKLSDTSLGLSDHDYANLAAMVDVIIHVAWSVNFLLPLRSFEARHLAGLRNLINFALSPSKRQVPPRMIFCSSVAAVSNYTPDSARKQTFPETIIADSSTSGSTGYARSKWVAEQICAHAHSKTSLKNRISIARVGQLSGGSDFGVWNASEAYPLMLSSAKVTGCLPDLDVARKQQGAVEGEVLGWLPVDIAARAFVEDILRNHNESSLESADNGAGIAVHHVLNSSSSTTWTHLLTWLSTHEDFETVGAEKWLSRLESLQDSADEEKRNHPALKLLGFWKGAYGPKATKPSMNRASETEKRNGTEAEQTDAEHAMKYEMAETYERMPSLRAAEGVLDEAYILKLWGWVKENV